MDELDPSVFGGITDKVTQKTNTAGAEVHKSFKIIHARSPEILRHISLGFIVTNLQHFSIDLILV